MVVPALMLAGLIGYGVGGYEPTNLSATSTVNPPGFHSASCTIKGNVSTRTGERIYHLPGQHYYSATIIIVYRF